MTFVYEGRYFTRYDLLKAAIGASGNKAVGLALIWEDLPLYQTIELIEAVMDIRQDMNAEDEDDWT